MELKIFKDKKEVAEGFCTYLDNLITTRETTYIALSGGSTPKIVFDQLVQNYAHLNWSKVHLFWGDERCVPPTHEDSNYKMTVDHLLSKITIPNENVHRIKGEAPPAEEAEAYGKLLEKLLPKYNGRPQFDLVVLGMGSDGHTASIFPHQIGLWSSEKCCEVADHPTNGQKRITITGSVINNARGVAFLVTGGEKQEKGYGNLTKPTEQQAIPGIVSFTGPRKIVLVLGRSSSGEYLEGLQKSKIFEDL